MDSLAIKRYIIVLFIAMIVLHSFNKFILRPYIHANDFHLLFSYIVNSLPNFIEAIVGSTVIIGNLSLLKRRIGCIKRIKNQTLYNIAVLIAGIYVILQELKIHNLGGNNTYDPYDIVASIIGLITIRSLIYKFGFSNAPSILKDSQD